MAAMGGECYRCGETRLGSLTLHHRYEGTRSRGNSFYTGKPGTLWYKRITVKTWAEVWLCDLLCHSCHHDLHATSQAGHDVWSYLRSR